MKSIKVAELGCGEREGCSGTPDLVTIFTAKGSKDLLVWRACYEDFHKKLEKKDNE